MRFKPCAPYPFTVRCLDFGGMIDISWGLEW